MRALAIALTAILFLAGCATQGNTPAATMTSAPAGKAQVVITRSSDMLYVAAAARVDLNGMRAASLWRGESYSGVVDPGLLTISTDAWSAPGRSAIRFNVEPGKAYFIELAPNAGSMWSGAALGLVGQAIEGNGPFQLVVKEVRSL